MKKVMTEMFRKIGRAEIRSIVALIDSFACYTIVFLILLKKIPTENRDLAIQIVATIVAGTIIQNRSFLYGSSKNESDSKKGTI